MCAPHRTLEQTLVKRFAFRRPPMPQAGPRPPEAVREPPPPPLCDVLAGAQGFPHIPYRT